MKRKQAVIGIAVVLTAGMFIGCAEPPTADLEAAKAALATAEKAEATAYADAELSAARQAIAEAEAELATQQGKFALSRKYDTAKGLIADAANKAAAAEKAAVANKDAAVKAAEEGLAALNATLGSIDAMVAHLNGCPKKPKGFDADMLVIGTQVDALKAEVAPVQEAISGADYRGALARVEAVSSQAATLTNDLQGAANRIGCPMPGATPAN